MNSNYLLSIIGSVLLHLGLGALVFWQTDFSIETLAQPKAKKVEVVQAVVVDASKVDAIRQQLLDQAAKKRQQEVDRQKKLEDSARKASENRKREERRLKEAEKKRKVAEQRKATAEKKRKQEDKKRLKAEKQRKLAEKKKAEADKQRKKAESERKEAEQQRKVEEKRKAVAEQKRAEAEKQRKAEEVKKAEVERQRIAEEKRKLEAEKKRKEAEDRQKELEQERIKQQIQQDLDLERKQREKEQAELKNRQRQREVAAAVDFTTDKIRARMQKLWVKPPDWPEDGEVHLKIRTSINGTILSVEVIQSIGVAAYDLSAEIAVRKMGELPLPEDEDAAEQFREFTFVFNPNGKQ